MLDFPFLNGVKTLNASLLRGKWLLTWEHNSIKCKSFSAYKQNYDWHQSVQWEAKWKLDKMSKIEFGTDWSPKMVSGKTKGPHIWRTFLSNVNTQPRRGKSGETDQRVCEFRELRKRKLESTAIQLFLWALNINTRGEHVWMCLYERRKGRDQKWKKNLCVYVRACACVCTCRVHANNMHHWSARREELTNPVQARVHVLSQITPSICIYRYAPIYLYATPHLSVHRSSVLGG